MHTQVATGGPPSGLAPHAIEIGGRQNRRAARDTVVAAVPPPVTTGAQVSHDVRTLHHRRWTRDRQLASRHGQSRTAIVHSSDFKQI
jgi:hypothetical protein